MCQICIFWRIFGRASIFTWDRGKQKKVFLGPPITQVGFKPDGDSKHAFLIPIYLFLLDPGPCLFIKSGIFVNKNLRSYKNTPVKFISRVNILISLLFLESVGSDCKVETVCIQLHPPSCINPSQRINLGNWSKPVKKMRQTLFLKTDQ